MTGYPRFDGWWAVALAQGGVLPRESEDDPDYRAMMRSIRQSAPLGWVVVTSHATSAAAVAWVEQMEGGRYTSALECGCVYRYARGHVYDIDRCDRHDSYKWAIRYLAQALDDDIQAS